MTSEAMRNGNKQHFENLLFSKKGTPSKRAGVWTGVQGVRTHALLLGSLDPPLQHNIALVPTVNIECPSLATTQAFKLHWNFFYSFVYWTLSSAAFPGVR